MCCDTVRSCHQPFTSGEATAVQLCQSGPEYREHCGGTSRHYNVLVCDDESLGFQNCISLLSRLCFFLDSFVAESPCSDIGRVSIESLLRSANDEPLINRDKLAMLERFRRRESQSLGTEHKEAERSPGRRGLANGKAPCIALVMVDREDVKDGTSSTETRSSGPGSPNRGEGTAG